MNSLIVPSQKGALQAASPSALPMRADEDRLDLRTLMATARRRFGLFCLAFGIVMVLTVWITLTQARTYTATTSIMLDPRQLQLFSGQSNQSVSTDLPVSMEAVNTQVEVIRSRRMAEQVIRQLHLDQLASQPRKLGLRGRLMQGVGKLFGGSDAPDPRTLDPTLRMQALVDDVLSSLDVERLGLTYVIGINYSDVDPDRAAAVTNAFANAYIAETLATKEGATKQASGFLDARLSQLSDAAARDAAAVQQYKISHNLLGTTGGTLTEQEISNLNQQVAAARAEAAADQARLSTAQSQLARGSSGDDVGAALGSPVIQSLRGQRSVVSGRMADLSTRYGSKHPEVLKTQEQLNDIDSQIRAEIRRVISNLKAQAQVSGGRLSSLEGTLGQTRGTLVTNTAAQAGLIQLQQKATASQTLYDTYLSRFKEIITGAGAEQSDARIVSLARVPTAPTSPRVLLNLALGVVLGAGLGLAAMAAAQVMDDSLATGIDVERRLHVPYLGSVPLLSSVAPGNKRTPPDYAVANPFSVFAEAFRSMRVSVLQATSNRPSRVVAITSPLIGEGKTTTAVCLGQTAAIQGDRTIIVDCDLRRRTLLRFIGKTPDAGLAEVISGTASLESVIQSDPQTGLSFLPLTDGKMTASDILGGVPMDKLLDTLRQRYDFIILDTPPLLALADARTLAAKCDAVIVLGRWRKTSEDALRSAIRLLSVAEAPLLGVTITRVDVRKQPVVGYGDSTDYYREAAQYYEAS